MFYILTQDKKIEFMVLENLSDLGIVIEISGFVLLLFFWKIPTYTDLFRWQKFLIFFKFFFGYEKIAKIISESKIMDDDDTMTRSTSLSVSSNNSIPSEFLRFWKIMKKFSILIVILGLVLQLSCLNFPT
ncbi:hypothetical protein YTPLAS73_09560 [Nitrosarchaeum sp.]|nr:hypothetical protein YTPLAS73_09560 [Nitrosarchaeum sp.]